MMKFRALASYALLCCLLLYLAACSQSTAPEPTVVLSGITAEYFGSTDFTGVSKARIDRNIHFDWQAVSPIKGLLPGPFSVRWQGYLISQEDEVVKPIITAQGEAKLFIEGREILPGQSLELKAKQSYALKLEYVKTGENASISLEWLRGGKTEVIAQKYFEPLAASLVLTPISGVLKGENLLTNADFEGNEGGWLSYGGQVQAVASDLIASSTSLSLKNWAWVQQDLPVSDIEVGTAYTLFGNAKAAAGASCMMAFAGGSASSKLFEQKVQITSDVWLDKEINVTLPAETVWLSVYMTSEQAECQFDDFSLVAGDTNPSAPPNLPVTPQSPLSNGDFDTDLSRWSVYGGTAALVSPGQGGSGKAIEINDFSWVQQDLISAKYIPGASYKLSAFGRSATSQECTLGYVISAASSTLVDERLVFTSPSWEAKSVTITVPNSFAWSAIFLSTGNHPCQFDTIRLEKQ
ncbi:MAG: hypothetical protein KC422_01010 [Trueperaceae bacterium]|nr:hypothetical protein [Trueperaceae bacterium]